MKLHSSLTINGKRYAAGTTISPWKIYPFFLIHMAMFGASGFLMAYGSSEDVPVGFLFMHGGIAITVYVVFYFAIFGRDEVKWMFINAALGIYGVIAQVDWILGFWGKSVGDFSAVVHVVPFLYYVLYTFLLRQMVLDFSGSRDSETKRRRVDWLYIGGSVLGYSALHLL